jgi:hypothetical protein
VNSRVGIAITLRWTVAASILMSAATAAHAIVDLTPTPGQYEAEGITYQQLIFTDDQKKVSYDLPRGWSYRFDAGRILLMPKDTAFAEAIIEAAPLPKPQPFDQPTIDKLRQQVLTAVPANSDAISITKSEQNPVILNGNLSYEIVVSYKTMGSIFQRSVLFINIPGTQLIFKLSARKTDFNRLSAVFRASVLTWQWVEASEAEIGPSKANEQAAQ